VVVGPAPPPAVLAPPVTAGADPPLATGAAPPVGVAEPPVLPPIPPFAAGVPPLAVAWPPLPPVGAPPVPPEFGGDDSEQVMASIANAGTIRVSLFMADLFPSRTGISTSSRDCSV
jgi:hypothetical protein